jgi:hypothetical protein
MFVLAQFLLQEELLNHLFSSWKEESFLLSFNSMREMTIDFFRAGRSDFILSFVEAAANVRTNRKTKRNRTRKAQQTKQNIMKEALLHNQSVNAKGPGMCYEAVRSKPTREFANQ